MLFGGPGVDPRTTFSSTFSTLPLSGDPWWAQGRQKIPAATKMTLKWRPTCQNDNKTDPEINKTTAQQIEHY
jgi:hypothetical protein